MSEKQNEFSELLNRIDKEAGSKESVDLKNPVEVFYYYHRPESKSDRKEFREMLEAALNYVKKNRSH